MANSSSQSLLQKPGTTRWRVQWTIRTLLLVMAVIAVPSAWIGESIRRVRHRVAVANAFNDAGAIIEARHAEVENMGEEIVPVWKEIAVGDWRSVDAVYFDAFPPHLVTDELFQQIRCFPSVQSVRIYGQPITDRGLEALRGMSQLDDVSIQACDISDATMPIIASLSNLSVLELCAVPVTDTGLKEIRSLPKLSSLKLHFTLVSPAGVDDLRRAMPDCEIDFIPATGEQVSAARNILSRYSDLTYHRDADSFTVLARDHWMRRDDWASLAAFPTIRSVSLNKVSSVSDALVHLRRLPKLEMLSIYSSPVSQEDIRQLASFGSLTHLAFDTVELNDGHLVEIGAIKQLEFLRINAKAAPVSSVGVEAISRLTHLKTLELEIANVGDQDMTFVSRLSDLEWLEISNTSVGDAGLDSILRLPKLQRLRLDGTRVSKEGIARVMASPQILDAWWLRTGHQPDTYTKKTEANTGR